MYLAVIKVRPLLDYFLELTFENKEIKIFDMKPYLNIGLFKTLRDEKLFQMVKISYDSIEWPNGIDMDPEILYEKGILKNIEYKNSKRQGTQVIKNPS